VFPLAPEPIRNEDGARKNDCGRKAATRLPDDLRREHPHMKAIIVEDGPISLRGSLRFLFTVGMWSPPLSTTLEVIDFRRRAASPVTIMPVGSSSSMSRRASRISIPLPCEDVWPTIRSTAAPNAGSTCPALPSASPTASAVSRPKAELPELPGGLVATEAERRHHSPAAIERGERHQRRQGLLSGCRRPCRRSGSGTSRNTDRIEIMPVNLPG